MRRLGSQALLFAKQAAAQAVPAAGESDASRAYLRYARMSVEMAFAECQHHSAQRLRHERMPVAIPPAESTHHSAPRGQKKARAGEGVRVEEHGQAPVEPLPGDWGPALRDRL